MTKSDPKDLRRGHVAVRLDEATIARMDALLKHLALPGRDATRTDALRSVIFLGLELGEKEPERLRMQLESGLGA
jgi:hypothetical protein